TGKEKGKRQSRQGGQRGDSSLNLASPSYFHLLTFPFSFFLFFVRHQDSLYQRVANDIVFVQIDKTNPLDVPEAVQRVHQPTAGVRRKVDLRHIAGDDDLGTVAHARQEHFHLRHGGVLPLIENDRGVVQRPAAHVRQRHDLDNVVVHVPLD